MRGLSFPSCGQSLTALTNPVAGASQIRVVFLGPEVVWAGFGSSTTTLWLWDLGWLLNSVKTENGHSKPASHLQGLKVVTELIERQAQQGPGKQTLL